MATEQYKGVLRGHWQNGSGESRNVFYCTGDGSDTDIAVTIQGWIAALLQIVRPFLSGRFTFYGVDVYKLIANDVWQLLVEAGLNISGGDSSNEDSPHQLSAVLVGRTANGKCKPKKFLPALTEGASDSNGLTSTFMAALANALAAWITDYTDQITNLTIHPNVYRKGKTALDFTGGAVDNYPGTQRRRKPGVGL